MNYCPILIPLLLMLKSYKEATETGSPCVSSFYESEGGRGELIQGRCLLKSGHLLKELCSVIFICDVCRNACRQIKIRSVPLKKKRKERLRQEAIPAFKWGQSWNMDGSFKMLATTEAAITQAICFHFLLEYWVSSAKSLMPLTTTHSVWKPWATTYTPKEEEKHWCLWTIY